MAQFTLGLSPEEQRELESRAAFHGMSVRDFILSKALDEPGDGHAAEEDAPARILANPVISRRLAEAMDRKPEDRRTFDSTGDVKRAPGI